MITAVQASDVWMRPFEQWIFRIKIGKIRGKLQEIGRLDLAEGFLVEEGSRRLSLKEEHFAAGVRGEGNTGASSEAGP